MTSHFVFSERFEHIRDLLLTVVEMPADERRIFLDAVCDSDPDLRAEIESLLRHDTPEPSLLDRGGALPPGLEGNIVELGFSSVEDAQPLLSPGISLAHYRIQELIGRGGMAEVYAAVDQRSGDTVAIKLFSPLGPRDSTTERRFLNEARAVSLLTHAGICRIRELGRDDMGRHFLVMDFLAGGSLRARLDEGPLAFDAALELVVAVAAGLRAAHARGILHRDIKPANIMFDADGSVKIIDFGIARVTGMTTLTRTGSVVGTVGSMSPEQIRGERVDERSDVFSCGVLMYETLTGISPFADQNIALTARNIVHGAPALLTAHLDTVPPGLQAVLDRALAKSRGDRYQSIQDMEHDLLLIRAGRGGAGHLLADRPVVREPSRQRRFVPMISAAAFFLLVFGWLILVDRQVESLSETPAASPVVRVGRSIIVWPGGGGEFPTIQGAVDAAADGDTILLGDGVFTGSGNHDLKCSAKAVVIRSMSDKPQDCIIDIQADKQHQARGLWFISCRGRHVQLRGVTIQGGWARFGGGLRIWDSDPIITRCVFVGNGGGDGGGVVVLAGSAPEFRDCIFVDNIAGGGGGGMYFSESGGLITGCLFRGNRADSGGGAIYLANSNPQITNCFFVANSSQRFGAALCCDYSRSRGIVDRCVFYRNRAPDAVIRIRRGARPVFLADLLVANGPGVAVLREEFDNKAGECSRVGSDLVLYTADPR